MAKRAVEELYFRPPDVEALVTRLRALAEAGDGWVNLQPGVPDDEVPPPPRGMAVLFTTPPVPVPVCTWVPGHGGRRGRTPDRVGVQHGSGAWAVRRLAAAGVPLPPGWRCRQDNARRGVVADVPPGTDPADVLSWLLRAGEELATVPLTGEWRAQVHLPR